MYHSISVNKIEIKLLVKIPTSQKLYYLYPLFETKFNIYVNTIVYTKLNNAIIKGIGN